MSKSYAGRRMVVDGLLIDSHAFEYGEEPEAFANTYHADELPDHVNRLQSENAKLRELVAELYALADGYTPDDSELDTARDLMRELGIEVPS